MFCIAMDAPAHLAMRVFVGRVHVVTLLVVTDLVVHAGDYVASIGCTPLVLFVCAET